MNSADGAFELDSSSGIRWSEAQGSHWPARLFIAALLSAGVAFNVGHIGLGCGQQVYVRRPPTPLRRWLCSLVTCLRATARTRYSLCARLRWAQRILLWRLVQFTHRAIAPPRARWRLDRLRQTRVTVHGGVQSRAPSSVGVHADSRASGGDCAISPTTIPLLSQRSGPMSCRANPGIRFR